MQLSLARFVDLTIFHRESRIYAVILQVSSHSPAMAIEDMVDRAAMASPMPDTMKRTGARTGTYICVSI